MTQKLIQANQHQRMYNLYTRYQDMLHREGVQTFANFSYVLAATKWGSWGVLEYQDQPIAQAHKYRALLDWSGTALGDTLAPT